MRKTRVFCFGFAIMLIFTSISSPVMAVETDATSSSVSSNSSTSSQSSSSISVNDTSSTADKATTAVSVVSTQDDPAAPTAADGVLTPDWNGSFLGLAGIGIPIITGFQVQPQAEQYVVANKSDYTGVADLSFKASYVANLLSKVKLTQTLWTWNSDTSSWVKTVGSEYKKGPFLTGNPNVDNTVTLPIGTYYVQYKGGFNGWLGTDYKISKLVKVVVVPSPVDAKTISPVVPNVMFEKASYSGVATTTPADATGKITWDSGLSGISWSQQTGRNSTFSFSGQSTTVNTSTTDPGIPTTFSTSIVNTGTSPGTVSGSDSAFTGGLVAKIMASDEGGTWSLNSQGLNDLETSVNPSGGDSVKWNYQWQVSTDGGNKFNDITTTNGDGVTNYQGTISDISKLPALTFSKTSGFITNAANATTPYVTRAILTATITAGNGSTSTVVINSNAARLTVTAATGKLSLDQVPTFDFGKVSTSDIYNGTVSSGQTKPESTSTLAITDSRVNSNGWNLTAKMSRFATDSSITLGTNTMIQMNNLMGNISAVLEDNNTATNILNSQQGNAGSWSTTGQLLLKANPETQLSDNQNLNSTITWNLTASSVKVPTAQ